jgi:hypothetical protein
MVYGEKVPDRLSTIMTEDKSSDIEGMLPVARLVGSRAVKLLYMPLPADLPIVDKYLLILMDGQRLIFTHDSATTR